LLSSTASAVQTEQEQGAGVAVSTDVLVQNLTAQTASGGSISALGRLELDPGLGQPFYLVASEQQRPRLVSQSLIQDVVVLQVGTFSLEEEAKALPPAAEGEPAADVVVPPVVPEATVVIPPDIITLIVTPQDAVTLNYLVYAGAKLSLALRSAQDDTRIQTDAVTLQFLLDQYLIPIPAKLPFGIEPRIDTLVPPVLPNDLLPPPGQ